MLEKPVQGMWAATLALVLATELSAGTGASAPAAGPPVGVAAGAVTAIVPMIVGGALMASDHSSSRQQVGVVVIVSGLALAPWVAHGVEGSWRRAAAYGGLTLALSAATVAAMKAGNVFDPTVDDNHRIPTGVLLSLSLAASAFAVVVSAFDHRPLEQSPAFSLWIAPDARGLAGGVGWRGAL